MHAKFAASAATLFLMRHSINNKKNVEKTALDILISAVQITAQSISEGANKMRRMFELKVLLFKLYSVEK